MSPLTLTARQRHALLMHLRTTDSVRVYRRTFALLEAAAGRPLVDVARQLGVGRRSLYRWIEAYQATRAPTALQDHYDGAGRPSVWTAACAAVVRTSLAQSPGHFGYQAGNWTVPLLQAHVRARTGRRLSASTLRRALHRLGYAWKRPRYVLQPDPDREKKAPTAPTNRLPLGPGRGRPPRRAGGG